MKAAPSPIAAVMALANNGPIPGIAIRRLHFSCCLSKCFDLSRYGFNPSVEVAPIVSKISKQTQEEWESLPMPWAKMDGSAWRSPAGPWRMAERWFEQKQRLVPPNC